jgi:hypothetical protein
MDWPADHGNFLVIYYLLRNGRILPATSNISRDDVKYFCNEGDEHWTPGPPQDAKEPPAKKGAGK